MSTTFENTGTVIEIIHLKKSFGKNEVLKDVNFTLKRGESIVVLGKSGCGKSVLIKCISGLMDCDGGEIHVLGKNIPKLKQRELDSVREKIGFLFQSSALYDSMTVRENLEFPLTRHLRSKTKKEINERVEEVLLNVGLLGAIDMIPSELSGGMRKRIGLARSLILRPEIMLYDEPTTGLDPITAKEISKLMLDMQKKYNTSSIIISHDMNCARLTSNRLMLLMDGVLYAQGTYEELEKSTDKNIKAFFE
ncbi:MAG TPA: ATP-binding cassette domain-containing protein [Bacteroidia bacterium]|jgi:phospholipid/cholesterol/gamma-HCH transport system ATP-binding protein|nr:ATP-binding cassette domain-containing protein [Bacteroidia bacterium]